MTTGGPAWLWKGLALVSGSAVAAAIYWWGREWYHSVHRGGGGALARPAPRASGNRGDGAGRPVLLVTDIGRDIDDSVALMTLRGLEERGHTRLVGVVTTSGDAGLRSRVARGWLRVLGYADSAVPVAASGGAESIGGCFVPRGTPEAADAALHAGPAADLVLELLERHQGHLVVLCIGPMTVLGEVLSRPGGTAALTRGASAVYIQGQAQVVPASSGAEKQASRAPDREASGFPRLEASSKSFNLRCDIDAAAMVFEQLQGTVPFTLLGKHAAYRVGLRRNDFEKWDELLRSHADRALISAEQRRAIVGRATAEVHGIMERFRTSDPDLFYKLYPVPVEDRDGDWMRHLDVVSHPYDPLLCLALARPELFDIERVGVHRLIGNSERTHGIPCPEAVHDALCAVVEDGLRML